MNIKKVILSLSAAMLASFTSVSAADFFNNAPAESLFYVGLRAGVNTSNVTVNRGVFDTWNNNSWGTGIDVGAVASINFRDYLSIEPGIFFESRSGKYDYLSRTAVTTDGTEYLTQYGNIHSYSFIIPILASVHFNISDDIRWNVDFGPYFQIILKNSIKGDAIYPLYSADDALPVSYAPMTPTSFDFGFKFGTSLKFLDHYLVGVHYQAGALKPWDNGNLGGRRKCWVFSVGYDF